MTSPGFSHPWTCPACGAEWVWVGEDIGPAPPVDGEVEPRSTVVNVRCWGCRGRFEATFASGADHGSLRDKDEWAAHWAAFAATIEGDDAAEVEPSLAWRHADAEQVAKSLVFQIVRYDEARLDAARRLRNVRGQLATAIEDQRKRYEQSVPEIVRRDSSYFDDEVLRQLALGDPSLLGPEQ